MSRQAAQLSFIRSLNIGTPKKHTFPQTTITTGICKEPVTGGVFLGKTGLAGDGVHDTRHHGGEDKALCFYSHEHYPFWSAELGITMPRPPLARISPLSYSGESQINFVGM